MHTQGEREDRDGDQHAEGGRDDEPHREHGERDQRTEVQEVLAREHQRRGLEPRGQLPPGHDRPEPHVSTRRIWGWRDEFGRVGEMGVELDARAGAVGPDGL